MEREFSTPSNNNNNYERSIGQCIVLPVDTETPCSCGGGRGAGLFRGTSSTFTTGVLWSPINFG